MEKTNRIKVFGLLALPIVALVLALMVFSIGHSTSNDVEASGPSQSLGASGAVDCGSGPFVPVDKPQKCFAAFIPGVPPKLLGFTITVRGDDLPAIAGFGAEVLPGGLTYNPRAACGDAVQMTPLVICTSNTIEDAGKAVSVQFGASTGATPPFLDGDWGAPRHGYRYIFGGNDDFFTCAAYPTNFGVSGSRDFFVDSSGVIRYDVAGNATAVSTPLGA